MKTPEDWIDDIVLPSLSDYLAGMAEHQAMSVVTHVHHVSDRVFHYYTQHGPSVLGGAKSETEFLDNVISWSQCLDLELARDVSNSTKHHFLRKSKGKWVNTATSALEISSSAWVIDGTGGYTVEDLVRNVIDFWRAFRRNNP